MGKRFQMNSCTMHHNECYRIALKDGPLSYTHSVVEDNHFSFLIEMYHYIINILTPFFFVFEMWNRCGDGNYHISNAIVRFDTVSLVRISSNYFFAVTIESIRGFQSDERRGKFTIHIIECRL